MSAQQADAVWCHIERNAVSKYLIHNIYEILQLRLTSLRMAHPMPHAYAEIFRL